MERSFHCNKRCSDKDNSLGLPEEKSLTLPEITEQMN